MDEQQTQNESAENVPQTTGLGFCPVCEGKIVETRLAYSCSNWKENGCKFAIWKTIAGREIDEDTATILLNKGETPKLGGFVSKKGNEFDAGLKIENGKVVFAFEDRE